MSIDFLTEIFNNLSEYNNWTFQILQINTSKRNGTSYVSRRISISPNDKISELIQDISNRYTSEELPAYECVDNYDGASIGNRIYKLEGKGELISTEFNSLITTLADPNTEIDPFDLKARASVFIGEATVNGHTYPVKLFSLQNPITTLKNKYLLSNGSFKEVSDKVLTIRTTFDAVIVGETVYLFTMAGENLFNMSHAYKTVCNNRIDEIIECNFISDSDAFKNVASSGHNPRRFVSFNEAHLQQLQDADTRARIAEKFSIGYDGTTFDTVDCKNSEKLVKLLCDKGKVDPFDDSPVEVAGSKKWV